MQHRHAEVHHDLKLPLRVAHAGGHSHGAHALDAVMHSQAAREKAVVHGVLEDVALLDSDHDEVAGHEVRPGLDILGGVADHGGLAGSAGRGMHPHHFLSRNGKEAEGIIVSQVLLFGSGQLCQVLQALNVLGGDARLLEFVLVKGNVFVNLLYNALETLQLQLFQLFSLHELQFRLPVIHFHTLVNLICSAYAMQCHERKRQGISIIPMLPKK